MGWLVTGSDVEGHAVKVISHESEGRFSRSQILTKARELLQSHGEATPLATLAREIMADDPLPGIDGIESWGEKARELVGAELEFGDPGGLGINQLSWSDTSGLVAQAFHWPETIVADVSGLRELTVELKEGGLWLADDFYPTGMVRRSFFEWRAYLGTGTLVAEGESEFEDDPVDPKRPAKAKVPLLGKSIGALIGRIGHWMGREEKPSHDRSFHGRLKHFEQKHPEIAQRYPDLQPLVEHPNSFAHKPKPGPALIFLHGTYSCAIPSLALLDPLPVQTFRFEHDTFQSISTNARELVTAMRQLAKPDPLYLVAHSRGGLVARLAARDLARDYRVIVRTYGTPHLGTPLANAGGRLLSALLAMGRTAAGGIFSWDPASLAVKSLLRSRTLPEGLDVMRTNSETLTSWKFGKEPFELITYGGEYDRRTLADGSCAYALGEATYGTFGRQANDLVVPTASARGAGDEKPVVQSCDHFHYFSIPKLKNDLWSL